jgi:Na+/H+ antiporter NhaD/arsenite permease-like protein
MHETFSLTQWLVLIFFILGYTCIIFEHKIGINKTTSALLTAAACWIAHFSGPIPHAQDLITFSESISQAAQIVFFLLGALAIIETIRVHGGFTLVSRLFRSHSKRVTLWGIGLVTFFLSSILDNLTTTVVMIALLRQLIKEHEERLLFGSVVVIAANAGGAWTPIGDVTTTMLWIGERLSTGAMMTSLFFPSLACLIGALVYVTKNIRGTLAPLRSEAGSELQPLASPVMIFGFLSLILVPILRALTGLPPFMGMLTALALLWMLTDLAHKDHPEREHLKMSSVFSKLDIMSILFFLGILLSVSVLDVGGILNFFATSLDSFVPSKETIPIIIGCVSAIVDNVPLVAACMGMYGSALYPINDTFWMLSAYCAGTGGSMLIIGSAAGVAFMGIEKVDFIWFMRKASIPAAVGYAAGIIVYLLQTLIM